MSRPLTEAEIGRKVYVGNLEPGMSPDELQSLFTKFGAISTVWVARNPPGFAFVTFEDSRDAEDAVAAMDGSKINNKHMRVEIARGPRASGKSPGGWKQRDDYRMRDAPLYSGRRSPSYSGRHQADNGYPSRHGEYDRGSYARARSRSTSRERSSKERFSRDRYSRERPYRGGGSDRDGRDNRKSGFRGSRYK